MKIRSSTTTPGIKAEISSPRAVLAFAGLETVEKIRVWLRRFYRVWNERRSLAADDSRVARTPTLKKGLGNTSGARARQRSLNQDGAKLSQN